MGGEVVTEGGTAACQPCRNVYDLLGRMSDADTRWEAAEPTRR